MATETNATIARALLADLKAGKSTAELTSSLAAFLIEERRQGDARAIVREVERRLLCEDGILIVRVTTAHPLSAEQQKRIEAIFAGQPGVKKVQLETTINKGVIGGVRCETAEARLDLTVRRQLQRLTTVAQ